MISPQAKEEILDFVDQFVPQGTTGVWLCGSRAKGSARPDSDWDVVVFHPAASRDPKEVFLSNQLRDHSQGGVIELVIVHPDHWNDPRLYFSDLRAFGIKLR
jgi:predicted nucleotidyltransferase